MVQDLRAFIKDDEEEIMTRVEVEKVNAREYEIGPDSASSLIADFGFARSIGQNSSSKPRPYG
jgi:hypothetical protein